MDSKAALRTEFLRMRRERTSDLLVAARDDVRRVVLARCAVEGWTSVAAYVPMRTEPGSVELLDALVRLGVRVLVPLVLADNDLDWQEWGSADPLGIDAVGTVDAVLVPALAVAADGTRLGRGGGSYDRALGRVRPGTTVAALLFDGETVPSLPADPWDVPVTAIARPGGWESRAEGDR